MGENYAVWDGSRWVSIRGEKGADGKALAIKGVKLSVADLPVPGVEGDLWIVAGDGYSWNASATPPAYENIGRLQGPAGPAGPKGDKGADGAAGPAGASATVTIAGTTTGAAGSSASVTNTGTASAASLSFVIPQGVKGDTGPVGPAPVLTVTSTTDTVDGNPASVSIAATGTGAYGLSFTIPHGPKGDAGSSITFKGKATTWPPAAPARGDAWVIGDPAPAGAPAAAGHLVTYDGAAWVDGGAIKGDVGPAGPTGVSKDAGNVATLGTDKLVFVPAGATPIATTTTLGGIIVGANLKIDAAGKLDATAAAVDIATTTKTGTVTLADANAITTKDGTKVVTAAQLVGQVDTRAPKAGPEFTGQVTLAAGTVAAPGLAYTGDLDTGLFLDSAGKVGVASDGKSVATFGPEVTITGNTFPAVTGKVGEVLQTDGAGKLSWGSSLSQGVGATVVAWPGDDLIAKYNSLKPKVAAGVRPQLVIMPGNYTLSAEWQIDTDTIDVIGLGSAPVQPSVFVAGNTLNVTAQNVEVVGISVGTQSFKVEGGAAAVSNPFQEISNCLGGSRSFSGSTRIVSGFFTGCKGVHNSFGGSAGSEACGTFNECVAGDSSFGYLGTASGTFTHCTCFGDGGFGSKGIASGTFVDCTSGRDSFGEGTGAASGTFFNCTGGADSFGKGGPVTGLFINCRLTSGSFPTVTAPGMTRNCINADGTIDNQGGYYGTDFSTPPVDKKLLSWDDTAKKWKPGIKITYGTTAPTGGANGDIYLRIP